MTNDDGKIRWDTRLFLGSGISLLFGSPSFLIKGWIEFSNRKYSSNLGFEQSSKVDAYSANEINKSRVDRNSSSLKKHSKSLRIFVSRLFTILVLEKN